MAAKPATRALTPITTPPHPGTAVKDAAPSMVSRIKRRLSAARLSMGTTGGRTTLAGWADAMDRVYDAILCDVKQKIAGQEARFAARSSIEYRQRSSNRAW